MFRLFLFVTYTYFTTTGAYGQVHLGGIPDSLRHKSYSYLLNKIENEENTELENYYSKIHLAKAKGESNPAQLMLAYKNFIYLSDGANLKQVYADSVVLAATKTKIKDSLASAHLTHGALSYSQKKYTEALQSYTAASNYLAASRNLPLKYKALYCIAQMKYYLGAYSEAITLFLECVDFYRHKNGRAYLNALHALGLCYNRVNDLDNCSAVNNKGLSEGIRLGITKMAPYFMHSEGVNQYFKKQYPKAIAKLQHSLIWIVNDNDFANEAVAHFYIGKSYLAMGKEDNAISCFIKVDRICMDKNYIRPDLRENYGFLIRYYKNKKDFPQQSYYVDNLIRADSILKGNAQNLTGKLYKEYDTKKQKENTELAKDKIRKDFISGIVIISLLVFSLLFVSKYKGMKKKYRVKFDKLTLQPKIPAERQFTPPLNIKEDVARLIYRHLVKFEKEKMFLAKDLTLTKIAILLHTNTKYASMAIHHYRGKKVIDYINELKVDYIVLQLREDKKFRNYTHKALAEEAGFTTTQERK